EHLPEVLVGAFQALDGVPMFRKLSQDRMMEVHGSFLNRFNSSSFLFQPARAVKSFFRLGEVFSTWCGHSPSTCPNQQVLIQSPWRSKLPQPSTLNPQPT